MNIKILQAENNAEIKTNLIELQQFLIDFQTYVANKNTLSGGFECQDAETIQNVIELIENYFPSNRT